MRWWIIAALALLVLQASALVAFGRPVTCECGEVTLWAGQVDSASTSQQFFDWYTLSHVVHGVIFFLVLSSFFPRLSLVHRFLIALALEAGWEIAENTPYVVDAYRQTAIARGYSGDSLLNSLMDTVSMAVGFLLASRVRAGLAFALILVLEAWAAWAIRDNLSLNILGFIHQFPAIEAWQAGR